MNKISTFFSLILTSTLVFFSASSAFAEPENLGKLRIQIEKYHDSGDYEREISKILLNTEKLMDQKVAMNLHRLHPKKLAIVLDIDETSLSYYSKMVQRQFSATQTQLHQEIHAANSPAIAPTLSLYNHAIKQHIAVFFVTGRKEEEKTPTLLNLKRAGYSHWAGIYFKPNNYNKASAIPYKSSARAAIINKGYTIIANIGDQYSDLKGGNAESKTKLPNPFYYLP